MSKWQNEIKLDMNKRMTTSTEAQVKTLQNYLKLKNTLAPIPGISKPPTLRKKWLAYPNLSGKTATDKIIVE